MKSKITIVIIAVVAIAALGYGALRLTSSTPNAGGEASVGTRALAPIAPPPRAPDYVDAALGVHLQLAAHWSGDATTHTLTREQTNARISFSKIQKNGLTLNQIAVRENITPSFLKTETVGAYSATRIACGGIAGAECLLIDDGSSVLEIRLAGVGLVTSDLDAATTKTIRAEINEMLNSLLIDR